MTEKRAFEDICIFSKYLNELCRLQNSGACQNVFTPKFRMHLKCLVTKLKDAAFADLEKYRNPNCASNCLPGHSIRTALLSMFVAKELRLKSYEIAEIGTGALLHDIGKLFLSKEILDKPCKLSESEFEVIKTHPELGFQLLENQFWLPGSSVRIVKNHHERLNGSGYPNQLQGIQIQLPERIVGVADVFDAMTSKRNYREALSYESAFQEIKKESPQLLDAKIILVLGEIIKRHCETGNEQTVRSEARREKCHYPCVE